MERATSHVTPKRGSLDSITLPESLDSPPITTLGVAVELVGISDRDVAIGTFETCRQLLTTSVVGGRPEVLSAQPKRRD